MPVKGKIFISTVSSDRSAYIRKIFQPSGAIIVDYPMISIKPAALYPADNEVFSGIKKFDWIIFTSRHGVIHFYNHLKAITGLDHVPKHIRFATIGIKTAEELELRDRKPDFTSGGNTSTDLVKELVAEWPEPGARILLPLGNMAPTVIEDLLKDTFHCVRINVYETVKNEPVSDEASALIREDNYAMILLTSPSAAIYLSERLDDEHIPLNVRVASIGSVTTAEAVRRKMNCLVTASSSTYEGLAKSITDYYTNH
jgi:uroporphyrinogen-III synthase